MCKKFYNPPLNFALFNIQSLAYECWKLLSQAVEQAVMPSCQAKMLSQNVAWYSPSCALILSILINHQITLLCELYLAQAVEKMADLRMVLKFDFL